MTQQANTPVALITGASSGIGAVFAERFAQQGHDLIIHGRRRPLLESLAERLQTDHGVSVSIVTADLAESGSIAQLEAIITQTPNLAVLVNNAGFGLSDDMHLCPADDQEAMITVHLTAAVRLTHAALQVMLPRRSGAIINVSSVAAYFISPSSGLYCATKAFLNTLTESLHLKLADQGIRLQALCPGFTRTDFHEKLGWKDNDPRYRMFMSAQDVVDKSLRDLDRGKVICIPGWKYRLIVRIAHLLPRPLLRHLIRRHKEA